MKKIISVLLCIVMLFALCSCSNTKTEEEAVKPERGKVENGVYTNDCIGFTFNGNEDWVYCSDEEIAKVYSVTAEEIFSEETGEILENVEMVYELYAYDKNSGENISLNFENLEKLYGEDFDEKEYLEATVENLTEQLKYNAALKMNKCELGEVEIGGKTMPCLNVELDMSTVYGFTAYEIVMAKKVGDYMAVITLTAMSDENVNALLELVSFA